MQIFEQRRKTLLENINNKHAGKKGIILLNAAFETDRYNFRQDSNFFYYLGLDEPGLITTLNVDGKSTLFVPQYGVNRSQWVSSITNSVSKEDLKLWAIDEVKELGIQCKGYQFSCLFSADEYKNLIEVIKQEISKGNSIFIPVSKTTDQKVIIERLCMFIPDFIKHVVDISDIVAKMRRHKTQAEIEQLYQAVDSTMSAHEAAAKIIEPDKFEYQIQAGIEFVFTETGGKPAFPSIVASGVNGATLHYTKNNSLLKKGDLVVVDIGAELNYYCADLTRTYPVSGVFNKRQRDLYTLVLETQEYVAEFAKPGYWLFNKDNPDMSLHHLAAAFLEKAGYGKYFNHRIGHFLGMDVHDVGDYSEPLQEGDVITIEPGIYIKEESLGIRIEDNYWILQDDNLCLSELLPKDPQQIEELMTLEIDDEMEFE